MPETAYRLPADLELSRRLERVEATFGARFVESRARKSPQTGAQWIEAAGAYAMFDGAASPISQTFGLGLHAELIEQDLDRIEEFFRERGAPVSHEVSPHAGVAVAEMLAQRGYRPVEHTNVLYAALPNPPAAPDPRFTVRAIAPGEEHLWSQVSAAGWALQPELTDFMLDVGELIAHSEGALAFFALLDDQPVATGALLCHEGAALFAGASTIPAARKLGAQKALFDARLAVAVDQRCDLAMMCAAPGSVSQRNAERQGFRIAYTRTKWQLT